MIKFKLSFLLVLLTLGFGSFAQQDAQFSQYMFNGLYFNPGYTGIENLLRTTLIVRDQWTGYDPSQGSGGAPRSAILSIGTPIKDYKIGVGAYFLLDEVGPLRNINANLSASKHFEINNGLLGLGINGGVYSQKFRNNYRVYQEDDDIYRYLVDPNNQGSQLVPDINAGIWYEHKKYYGGVSFYHIPRANFDYGSSKISSELSNHMYITAGYRLQPAHTITVTPSFLIQTDLHQITYLFGGLVEYNKKIWAGLHVRQSIAKREESKGGKTLSNDDIILYLGINVLKNKQNQDALRVGYAFDFVTNGASAKARTSHEIMLSYMIPNVWGPDRPPVRTPRYRHEN
jgi:type IX secretion system PorP/SprF family membrane protein